MVSIIIDHCHPLGLIKENKYAERIARSIDGVVSPDIFPVKSDHIPSEPEAIIQEIIIANHILEDDYTDDLASMLKKVYPNLDFEKIVCSKDFFINKLMGTINAISAKYPDELAIHIMLRTSKHPDAIDAAIQEMLINRFNSVCIETNENQFPDLNVCRYITSYNTEEDIIDDE